MKRDRSKLLSIFLFLISAHSFLVGICLILAPFEFFSWLGFTENIERFFPAQGGTFHIIMSICYFMAARNIKKHRSLVLFTIIVKFIASVFLLFYFLLVKPIPLVLLSLVTDFLSAIIVYSLFSRLKNDKYF